MQLCKMSFIEAHAKVLTIKQPSCSLEHTAWTQKFFYPLQKSSILLTIEEKKTKIDPVLQKAELSARHDVLQCHHKREVKERQMNQMRELNPQKTQVKFKQQG